MAGAAMKSAPLLSSIAFHLFVIFSTTASSNCISLKLIHPFARDSPLHYPNLTHTEIIQKSIKMSRARIYYLVNMIRRRTNATASPEIIQPRVVAEQDFQYLVEVEIGTPPVPYHLLMDTGSSLTWVQCRGCNPCYSQLEPYFDRAASSTYSRLPCTDPLCKDNECDEEDDMCIYTITYEDDSYCTGQFSTETFQFETEDGEVEAVTKVGFGCGLHDMFDRDPYTRIAGIMGLGREPQALQNQLSSITEGRFGHCFVHWKDGYEYIESYLRFGDEALIDGEDVAQTEFVPHSSFYYLNLIDISIGDWRMNFPPGTFALTTGGDHGGCMIDSGTMVNWMVKSAYDEIKYILEQQFELKGLQPLKKSDSDYDLCYSMPLDFEDYPSMTYHFEGADLFVPKDNAFMVEDGRSGKSGWFCWATLESSEDNNITIIGAAAQQNLRVVYDTNQQVLMFKTDDCREDIAD